MCVSLSFSVCFSVCVNRGDTERGRMYNGGAQYGRRAGQHECRSHGKNKINKGTKYTCSIELMNDNNKIVYALFVQKDTHNFD